eukprot:symbB.v1.2.002746.t1/scaffold146.1/size298692/27
MKPVGIACLAMAKAVFWAMACLAAVMPRSQANRLYSGSSLARTVQAVLRPDHWMCSSAQLQTEKAQDASSHRGRCTGWDRRWEGLQITHACGLRNGRTSSCRGFKVAMQSAGCSAASLPRSVELDVQGLVGSLSLTEMEKDNVQGKLLERLQAQVHERGETPMRSWLETHFRSLLQELHPASYQRLSCMALRVHQWHSDGPSPWEHLSPGKILESFKEAPAHIGKAAVRLFGKFLDWVGGNPEDEADKKPDKENQENMDETESHADATITNTSDSLAHGDVSNDSGESPKASNSGEADKADDAATADTLESEGPAESQEEPLAEDADESRFSYAKTEFSAGHSEELLDVHAVRARATGLQVSANSKMTGLDVNTCTVSATGASITASVDAAAGRVNIGNASFQGASASVRAEATGCGVDAFNFQMSGPSVSAGISCSAPTKLSFGNVSVGLGFNLHKDLNPLNWLNLNLGGGGGGGGGGESGGGLGGSQGSWQEQLQDMFPNKHVQRDFGESTCIYRNGVLQRSSKFQIGDHIKYKIDDGGKGEKYGFEHHYLVTDDLGGGRYEVIEKTKDGNFTGTRRRVMTANESQKAEFVQSSPAPMLSLSRAKKDLGDKTYNPVINNCEQAVTKWVNGKAESEQVQSVVNKVKTAATFAALPAVAAAATPLAPFARVQTASLASGLVGSAVSTSRAAGTQPSQPNSSKPPVLPRPVRVKPTRSAGSDHGPSAANGQPGQEPANNHRTNDTDQGEAGIDPRLLRCIQEMAAGAGLEDRLSQFLSTQEALDTISESQKEDEEDTSIELCDFCKKENKPCCMKCLLGRSSKKVAQIRGNIHGFS